MVDHMSDVQAAIQAVERYNHTTPFKPDDSDTALWAISNNQTIQDVTKCFDRTRLKPVRPAGNTYVDDLQSFAALVSRFADPDETVIFANEGHLSITAILNHHTKLTATGVEPGFGDHRVVYKIPKSDEWKAWMDVAGVPMSQGVFAEFIEDHGLDIVGEPVESLPQRVQSFLVEQGLSLATPRQMVEFSRGLAVHRNRKVDQKVNLSTGEVRFQTEDEDVTKDGTKLKIPGAFMIRIPVFLNGPTWLIPVRLRYRIKEGTINWSIAPYKADLVQKTAFDEIVDVIEGKAAATKDDPYESLREQALLSHLPLYRGTAPDEAKVRP